MTDVTLRRTQLATPGSSPEMIEKAAESDADEAFLDLEDSVASGEMVDEATNKMAKNIVACARQANVL